MSSRRTQKTPVIRSRKAQPDPYTARIPKTISKRELKDHLGRAVRSKDFDALENYDEENLRPPTGAVTTVEHEPKTSTEDEEENFDFWRTGLYDEDDDNFEQDD